MSKGKHRARDLNAELDDLRRRHLERIISDDQSSSEIVDEAMALLAHPPSSEFMAKVERHLSTLPLDGLHALSRAWEHIGGGRTWQETELPPDGWDLPEPPPDDEAEPAPSPEPTTSDESPGTTQVKSDQITDWKEFERECAAERARPRPEPPESAWGSFVRAGAKRGF